MSNGIVSSSHDVTKVILHLALDVESPNTKRKQFAVLRLRCKLWKDIVDSLTDCLSDDDLLLAVEGGNVESLRFLLTRAELDPSSKDIELLCNASKGASTEIVRLLLNDLRVDVSAEGQAFITAAKYGRTGIVQLLLSDERVDPSVRDNQATIKAASKGHDETVRLLLSDSRVDPSVHDNSAIIHAVSAGHNEIIRLLLSDSRVDPSAQDNQATKQQPLLLSDSRVDSSADDNYVIIHAAIYDHSGTVRVLLSDPRLDPSAKDNYAIRAAASMGYSETVRLLLSDSRVDPSSFGNYAIKQAASKGYSQTVSLLLSHPCVDPSADDNYGIRFAAGMVHSETVRLLLSDPRVDPSAEYDEAITRATEGGYMETVRLLLADERVDPSRHSLVLASAARGHTDVVELLLSHPRVDASAQLHAAKKSNTVRTQKWCNCSIITSGSIQLYSSPLDIIVSCFQNNAKNSSWSDPALSEELDLFFLDPLMHCEPLTPTPRSEPDDEPAIGRVRDTAVHIIIMGGGNSTPVPPKVKITKEDKPLPPPALKQRKESPSPDPPKYTSHVKSTVPTKTFDPIKLPEALFYKPEPQIVSPVKVNEPKTLKETRSSSVKNTPRPEDSLSPEDKENSQHVDEFINELAQSSDAPVESVEQASEEDTAEVDDFIQEATKEHEETKVRFSEEKAESVCLQLAARFIFLVMGAEVLSPKTASPLRTIIEVDEQLHAFRQYLEKSFSDELMEFWLAVESLNSKQAESTRTRTK
ncbi:ankyrin repeat domain-containing protein 50-like [Planoprotostelium fungivorum]|uniref:Ankyrin repeat domain-containing protein 50-like n=1 Tax=Planoprotostelium fungivorum TaxID=1890364 RepID=A0A2P6N3X3_9EUKA|nr:ankyrin repeat domain-containing protein 50-like [Planoprotostelium fungivorum]